jgi:hypothetical protein
MAKRVAAFANLLERMYFGGEVAETVGGGSGNGDEHGQRRGDDCF